MNTFTIATSVEYLDERLEYLDLGFLAHMLYALDARPEIICFGCLVHLFKGFSILKKTEAYRFPLPFQSRLMAINVVWCF